MKAIAALAALLAAITVAAWLGPWLTILVIIGLAVAAYIIAMRKW